MQTTTETVLLITIWTLTSAGLFFGIRAKIRKRRKKGKETGQDRQKTS